MEELNDLKNINQKKIGEDFETEKLHEKISGESSLEFLNVSNLKTTPTVNIRENFKQEELKKENLEIIKTTETSSDEILEKKHSDKDFFQKNTLIKEKNEVQDFLKKTPVSLIPESLLTFSKKNYPLQTIRTYKGDVADILKNQKTSITDIVVAEKKREEKEPKNIQQKISNSKKRSLKSFLILFVFIFTLGIIGLIINYIINKNINNSPIEITEFKIPTFIFPNFQREVLLSGLKKDKVFEEINIVKNDINIPLGSIIQLYLTNNDPTKNFVVEQTEGNKLLITTESFFKAIETKTPASLTRAMEPDFMFGYHSSLENSPFLVFKIKSYENSFAGMLAWEKTIMNDLNLLFKKDGSTIDILNSKFEDIIIENKDVRAVLNTSGKIEFAYSFPNKETLIIINNETTLKEIYRRIIMVSLERKN